MHKCSRHTVRILLMLLQCILKLHRHLDYPQTTYELKWELKILPKTCRGPGNTAAPPGSHIPHRVCWSAYKQYSLYSQHVYTFCTRCSNIQHPWFWSSQQLLVQQILSRIRHIYIKKKVSPLPPGDNNDIRKCFNLSESWHSIRTLGVVFHKNATQCCKFQLKIHNVGWKHLSLPWKRNLFSKASFTKQHFKTKLCGFGEISVANLND